MNPTKVSYDVVVPAALPAQRPITFVSPVPTSAMLAERKADAEALALAQKKTARVPLAIRFLRLLESRSVQHNMTTPTVFHRVLKRRRSIPNKHFLGYQDEYPHLEAKLRPEMVGNNAEVHLHVVWRPAFFASPFVQNDMDVTWSSEVVEVVEPPKKPRKDGEEESSDSSDDDEAAALKLRGPGLAMPPLVAGTRAHAAAERAEAEKKGAVPLPHANPWLGASLKEWASLRLMLPPGDLKFRGDEHRENIHAVHRPSLRRVEATTTLRVSPKGEVWRLGLDAFEPFVESDPEESDESEAEADGDDDEDAPPDPFGDVNAAEAEDPYVTKKTPLCVLQECS
jgi:hypothetical protein